MLLDNHNGDPVNSDQHTPECAPVAVVDSEAGAAELLYSGPEGELIERFGGVATGPLAHIISGETEAPSGDVYTRYHDPETGEVHVTSTLTRDDYEAATPPKIWAQLEEYAEANRGNTIIRINATAYGGGVAIMNESWVHLMRELGVDAHWYAMDEDVAGSSVTKFRFHNGMQNVAPEEEITLTEDDKLLAYEPWVARNARKFEEPIRGADVIIIDDAQPSRLIRSIKGFTVDTAAGSMQFEGWNPDAPLIYRDHIHSEGELMTTPGTPQYGIWDYLWNDNGISQADVFVIHPVDEFAPPNVPENKIVKMPATADKLGDLLRDLSKQEIEQGFDFINEQLWINGEQSPIDRDRPYIALIARFDESKNMDGGMEFYARAVEKMKAAGVPEGEIPQLVIIGNGAYDDQSGPMMLAKVMALRASDEMSDIREDIKVARVPHNDAAINAILRGAKIALQPSIKEGSESRVTDAILMGVPVIGSDRGGIPLQIKEGGSGYIIDPDDTERWAERITELIADESKYMALKQGTEYWAKAHNEQFTTPQNLINWLYLSKTLLADKAGFNGDRRWVSEMAASESESSAARRLSSVGRAALS